MDISKQTEEEMTTVKESNMSPRMTPFFSFDKKFSKPISPRAKPDLDKER